MPTAQVPTGLGWVGLGEAPHLANTASVQSPNSVQLCKEAAWKLYLLEPPTFMYPEPLPWLKFLKPWPHSPLWPIPFFLVTLWGYRQHSVHKGRKDLGSTPGFVSLNLTHFLGRETKKGPGMEGIGESFGGGEQKHNLRLIQKGMRLPQSSRDYRHCLRAIASS